MSEAQITIQNKWYIKLLYFRLACMFVVGVFVDSWTWWMNMYRMCLRCRAIKQHRPLQYYRLKGKDKMCIFVVLFENTNVIHLFAQYVVYCFKSSAYVAISYVMP